MFFSLAFNAYLPHLLTSDDRLEGNTRLQTSAQAARSPAQAWAGCWRSWPGQSADCSPMR